MATPVKIGDRPESQSAAKLVFIGGPVVPVSERKVEPIRTPTEDALLATYIRNLIDRAVAGRQPTEKKPLERLLPFKPCLFRGKEPVR